MDTVYHLGKILLLIQVCELKNETLHKWLDNVQRIISITHLRQSDMPNKVKEIVDIIRMTKIQLGCLYVEFKTRHHAQLCDWFTS